MPAACAAIPLKPNTAEIIAITRKSTTQLNIFNSPFSFLDHIIKFIFIPQSINITDIVAKAIVL